MVRPCRPILAAVLALLASGVAASAASAKTEFTPEQGSRIDGFIVADGRAYWSEYSENTHSVAFWTGTPGGKRVRLFRTPPGSARGGTRLSASAGRLYAGWYDAEARSRAALIDAAGDHPVPGDMCDNYFDVHLVGSRLLYDDAPRCDDGGFVSFDVDAGAPVGVPAGANTVGSVTAGRLLAWVVRPRWNAVAVADAVTGALVRYVPLPPAPFSWNRPAIAADGTVGILLQDADRWPYSSSVWVARPGSQLRRIVANALNLTVASGVAMFRQQTSNNPVRQQVVATDLDGKVIQGFWSNSRGLVRFDGRVVATGSARGGLLVSEFPVPGEKALPVASPAVKRFTVSPKRFGIVGYDKARAGRRKLAVGARMRFSLQRKGAVSVRIDRLGRRRAKKVGTLALGHRTSGSYRFTGYVAGRRLRRGRYRATLTATADGFAPSRGRSVTFRIVKPR